MARIFVERRQMDDELRRLFERLTRSEPREHAGECPVALDVIETSVGLEVIVDAVGIEAEGLQVIVARDTLVVTGVKRPAGCQHHDQATFHVAERVFGRFARAVRLSGAFDVARTDAALRDGELRVRLPRMEERRGREHRIPIRTE